MAVRGQFVTDLDLLDPVQIAIDADHLERHFDLLETVLGHPEIDLVHPGIGIGFLGIGIVHPETGVGLGIGIARLEIDLVHPGTGFDYLGIEVDYPGTDPGRLGMRLRLKLA